MNLYDYTRLFLTVFVIAQVGCTTLHENKKENAVNVQGSLLLEKNIEDNKKAKKERQVDTRIDLPFSKAYSTKELQQSKKKLTQIKPERKESLYKKGTKQEKKSSLDIVIKDSVANENIGIIKTVYDSRIDEFNKEINKLLLKYTKKHPDVRIVEKAKKELEAKRVIRIKSILKSAKTKGNNLEHSLFFMDSQITPIAKNRKFEHPGGLHSRAQLDITRNKIEKNEQPWLGAFEALKQQANIGLNRPPEAVRIFNIPGLYNGDAKGHRLAMNRLSNDAWVAYFCAIAYQLSSGIERIEYADKVVQILGAWAKTNKKVSNHDGDLAMVSAGTGLIFAAELMTDYDGWKKKQRVEFNKWLVAVYLKSCKKISRRANNLGNWGNLGCIASHYFRDDVNALDADIKQIIKKIDKAIRADGSMPLETRRGKNGIWYTYFALAPLTSASQIALNAREVNLFQYKGVDGAGIEEALDYILWYSLRPERWPHYRGSDLHVSNKATWLSSLFEAMYGIYGKKEYKAWIKNDNPIIFFGHTYAWAVPSLLRTNTSPHGNVYE